MEKKVKDWNANIPFSVHSIPQLSRDLLIGNLAAKGTLELPLDTVLVPNVQHEGFRRWSAFVRDRPFFLTPRTRLDASSTHLRRWVELGCKTRVEPGSRCTCERCKVG